MHAATHQALLELDEHGAAKAAAAPVARERQKDDPAAVAADARGRRADHDLAHRGHDRDTLVP
jgi:hypothetical protein